MALIFSTNAVIFLLSLDRLISTDSKQKTLRPRGRRASLRGTTSVHGLSPSPCTQYPDQYQDYAITGSPALFYSPDMGFFSVQTGRHSTAATVGASSRRPLLLYQRLAAYSSQSFSLFSIGGIIAIIKPSSQFNVFIHLKCY